MVKIHIMILWVITKLRMICILPSAKYTKFLSYLNGQPAGNSEFKLGTQNEGNCPTVIIKLRIICTFQYAKFI
jgi:hypothetical protein